jgi:hypothetical protein
MLTSKKYISEIALKAGDVQMQLLDRHLYEHALLVSFRKVARKYEILESIYVITNKTTLPGALIIDPCGFDKEFRVVLNNEYLRKVNVNNELNEKQYCIWEQDGSLYFDYRGEGVSTTFDEADTTYKVVGEEIEIYYLANVTENNFRDYNYPIIPDRYRDELISTALNELGKVGIMKAKNEEERARYTTLLQIYSEKKLESTEPKLEKNNAPIITKPFQVY